MSYYTGYVTYTRNGQLYTGVCPIEDTAPWLFQIPRPLFAIIIDDYLDYDSYKQLRTVHRYLLLIMPIRVIRRSLQSFDDVQQFFKMAKMGLLNHLERLEFMGSRDVLQILATFGIAPTQIRWTEEGRGLSIMNYPFSRVTSFDYIGTVTNLCYMLPHLLPTLKALNFKQHHTDYNQEVTTSIDSVLSSVTRLQSLDLSLYSTRFGVANWLLQNSPELQKLCISILYHHDERLQLSPTPTVLWPRLTSLVICGNTQLINDLIPHVPASLKVLNLKSVDINTVRLPPTPLEIEDFEFSIATEDEEEQDFDRFLPGFIASPALLKRLVIKNKNDSTQLFASGELIRTIQQGINIEELSIKYFEFVPRSISDALIDFLIGNKNLKHFKMNELRMPIQTFIKAICTASNLKTLQLSALSRDFRSHLPLLASRIGDLPHLEVLSLKNNAITNPYVPIILEMVQKLPNLKILDVSESDDQRDDDEVDDFERIKDFTDPRGITFKS